MKKIIAVLLALVMVFVLTACGGEQPSGEQTGADNSSSEELSGSDNTAGEGGESGGESGGGNAAVNPGASASGSSDTGYATTVYGESRKFSTSGGVQALNDLSNTYYKLTKEKKLTVGFIGGSVTDGSGGTNGYCFARGVTEWLKESYPSAEITETNNGWGNKSSIWGYFRADGDTDWGRSSLGKSLLSAKPDLVFIEFAINDYLLRLTDEETVHYVEGIICKLRKALPETDIVLVLITNESYIGKELPTSPIQRKLAAYYGIPVIDVGAAMNEHLKKTGKPFGDFFTDTVHPNNAGYKVYADAIAEYLKEAFSKAKATGVKACEMPKNYYLSGATTESVIITAEQLAEIADISDWTLMKSPSNQVACFGKSLYGLNNAKLTFDIEGTGLCMMVDARFGSSLKCVIDGKETVIFKPLSNTHVEWIIANNLTRGKHKIELTVTSTERFIIGAVMVEN